MEIKVERFFSGQHDTLGRMSINGQFMCYTLEDEYRDVFAGKKVKEETRIPEGTYKIKLRTIGRIHENYKAKFKEPWHQGTLEIQDVPYFQAILIHIGNTDKDTAGCILVGSDLLIKGRDKKNAITGSTIAYKKIYPLIRDAILNNEDVNITISTKESV